MGQAISRSEAREIAVRVIFADGFDNGAAKFNAAGCGLDDGVIELALDGKTATAKELEFINKILLTVSDRLNEIDKLIEPHLKGWTLDRLSKTDLAVLRTAAAEMLIGETARPVIINECVAISKKYGTENAGNFINGILVQIIAEQPSRKTAPQNIQTHPTGELSAGQNPKKTAPRSRQTK